MRLVCKKKKKKHRYDNLFEINLLPSSTIKIYTKHSEWSRYQKIRSYCCKQRIFFPDMGFLLRGGVDLDSSHLFGSPLSFGVGSLFWGISVWSFLCVFPYRSCEDRECVSLSSIA